ncbi:MAG: serine hydrolase [Salinivirgaceae bacterium]|nr:serine hydrolase [Salinivirgaceae bacterium]
MNLKTISLISACLILTLSSCQSQNYKKPKQKNDNWQTASSDEFDINHYLLSQLYENLNNEIFPNTHSVLIIKDNKLIFEKYLNGFNEDRKQFTASVSKSVGSILTGIAIEEGLLESINNGILEKNISDLFNDYKSLLNEDSLKSTIRFKHILSMSGGLDWDEHTYPYSDRRNDWIAASHSIDPFVFLFEKKMVTKPGNNFNYNGGYSLLLSKQIQDITGKSALEYAKEKLFKPLKIKEYEWESVRCGLTDTDGGLHLLPRDMAKIGQLYLNNGRWDGEQIVDSNWVKESTKEQIISEGMPNYGFQWWCGTFHSKAISSYTYFTSGLGGQKIYVFPEFNVVIVITHQVFDNNYGELNNIKILSNYILPSLVNTTQTIEPIILSITDLNKYVGVYSNDNESFEIKLKNNQLIVSEPNRPEMVLSPNSNNKFTSILPQGIDVVANFHSNSEKGISGMDISFSFNELSYKKIQ